MSYKQTVLDLTPVHFVHDNLVDEAGPNDLTAVGATRQTTDTPGDGIPDYWQLDGIDDYLWAADHAVFDIAGQQTVVWWVRRDGSAQGSFANYWAKGDAVGYQARMEGTTVQSVRFDLRNGSANSALSVASIPAADTWYLRVCRYNQTVMEVLNVDNPDGSITVGDSTPRSTAIGTNAQRWTVAAQNDTGTNIRRFWRGDLTAPIIFDYALSNAEITSIWAARNNAEDVDQTSLFATGTQTIVDVVNEADNTTDLHLSVDDDPATPDDDDWVNNAVDVT